MSMFIIAVTNGALLSGSRHLPTIYPVFSLKCASLPGLRPSSIPPGFNHKSTPLVVTYVTRCCFIVLPSNEYSQPEPTRAQDVSLCHTDSDCDVSVVTTTAQVEDLAAAERRALRLARLPSNSTATAGTYLIGCVARLASDWEMCSSLHHLDTLLHVKCHCSLSAKNIFVPTHPRFAPSYCLLSI